MQTMGTTLVAIKRCSPVRVSMPVQGGRSAGDTGASLLSLTVLLESEHT
jgi:hypothetical protein